MKFSTIPEIKDKINNKEPLNWMDIALISGFSKEEILKMSTPKCL